MLRNDHRSLNCLNNLKILVGAGSGSTVVLGDAASRLHAVGSTKAAVLGHTIVGTIEAQVGNAIVALDAGSLLKTSGNVLIDLAEDSNLALDDFLLTAIGHVSGHVLNEALLRTVIEDLIPQGARCNKVLGSDLGEESDGVTNKISMDFVEVNTSLTELDRCNRRQVWRTTSLVVDRHIAISLKIAHAVWHTGGVDRKLLVVDADTVAVSVGVREQTTLENRVRRRLNTWRHMSRVESDLLNLGKVVLDVLVQSELSNLAKRELGVRPDVSQVKHIDLLLLPEILSLLSGHSLDANIPAGIFTILDGEEKILLVSVRRVVVRILLSDEASALLGLEVDLRVHPLALLVHKLSGVSKVTVHLSPVLRNATIAHKDHDLVNGLGVLGKIVPEHGRVVGVSQMCGRITLLGVDEVRELGWVPQEKHGSVVGYHIPVALVGAELDRETTGISGDVVRARFTTNGGEPDGNGALLALLENIGHTNIVERVCGLVETVSTTALSVDNTLRNTLAIEVREKIDQVEVL